MARTPSVKCSGFSQENVLLVYTETTPNKGGLLVLPFGIIEKDEHTRSLVVLKTLIVMAVSIAN